MVELAAKYKKAADEKMEEIVHLSKVSQDSAYREGFRHEALCRAQTAAETDKVFFSGLGVKGVLILGISTLEPKKAQSVIASSGGWKSHANSTLLCLDGEKGEIRKNKAGTCWIIDLASPRRTAMFAWESGPKSVRLAGPRLNTTNGAAHWCGLVSEMMPFNTEMSPHTASFLKRAVACMTEHGMTPKQWERAENARRTAESERRSEIICAATKAGQIDGVVVCVECGCNPTRGENYILAAEELAGTTGPVPENLAELVHAKIAATKLAAEEARIMAELKSEQLRITEAKIEAEVTAKQQVETEKVCRLIGVSFAEWQGLTPKQQRQALHRARLAGKLQTQKYRNK